MKAPAHIATGFTFTGILCSIFDINIFSSYTTTIVCICFSLLPDIDTTKSLFGKIFYPVAYLLSRKFGHRTITHSLLFLLFVLFIFKILVYFEVIKNTDLTMIACFALFSHLILDMFTISGVPFFYPFIRNSCVIPGNPNYRFAVGDLKSELIVTGICGILAFSMQPLFQNGFWTSYNRSFATIKHVHRENNNSDKYTLCDYSFIDNNISYDGTALVIESQTNEITLFDKGQIFVLNSDDPMIKVNHVKPRPSSISKLYDYIQFFNITIDSLQSYLGQNLVTGLIQSNYNVEYMEKSIIYHTNFINIKNRYNFYVNAIVDSTTSKNTELAELEATQIEESRRYYRDLNIYNIHIKRISELDSILKLPELSNYERNKSQNEIISMRNRTVSKPIFEPSLRLQVRIDELRRSISARNLLFSGHLTIFRIVDPSLPEVREIYPEININFYADAQSRKSVYEPINK